MSLKSEEEIQAFWEKEQVFQKTLEESKGGKEFVFFDGPPFATGTPHYGHLVASTIKDIIPRYKTQTGHYVERRWGWDCVAEGTLVNLSDGTSVPIEKMSTMKDSSTKIGIYSYFDERMHETHATDFFDQGQRECMKLVFENGSTLECTGDHRIMTKLGYKQAKDLSMDDMVICFSRDVVEHTILQSKENVGLKNVYDICVPETSNFIANGIVVHNCHGVPIEFEIEKQLNIKTKDEVLKYGIDRYNEACRGIVMKYRSEWKDTINRLGRFVDMENDYKTMDKTYMESEWWAFSELYKKGLVYRGILLFSSVSIFSSTSC